MIQKLSRMIDMLQDIWTGTSSCDKNKMLLDFEDKRYLVSFKEIPKNKDMFKDIDKYLE